MILSFQSYNGFPLHLKSKSQSLANPESTACFSGIIYCFSLSFSVPLTSCLRDKTLILVAKLLESLFLMPVLPSHLKHQVPEKLSQIITPPLSRSLNTHFFIALTTSKNPLLICWHTYFYYFSLECKVNNLKIWPILPCSSYKTWLGLAMVPNWYLLT